MHSTAGFRAALIYMQAIEEAELTRLNAKTGQLIVERELFSAGLPAEQLDDRQGCLKRERRALHPSGKD